MTHGSRKAANALAQPPPFIRLHYPSAWMRRCLDAVACPVHSNTTVRHVHADLGPRHAISKSGRSREYMIDAALVPPHFKGITERALQAQSYSLIAGPESERHPRNSRSSSAFRTTV